MAPFNRGTGLLVIEVRHSNPNGDPDQESEPRTIDADGRGLISPVSFKRKLRDLVADKDGPAWQAVQAALSLSDGRGYEILETRGRDRGEISKMDAQTFTQTFWDARIFGNTFLESMKGADDKGNVDHFISTGVVQFGPGVSISRVEVERMTTTNKAGVQEGKDRGMAPLGWRVVQHGVYAMPFFVNPMMARKNGCEASDIELMKFLLPHAYRSTASAVRPFVEVRHAWYAEHQSPLGSCPDSLIIDALTPRRVEGQDPQEPSASAADYDFPGALPEDVRKRLASFEDLVQRDWENVGRAA
ncbi:MAG: type I CRISPR-associated protein Cas7 [Gemmatimonadetes bacterium]|jgi:Cas7 group CRISPR-associated protein Csh2|nr:type I CRISPR-associated protein Cas7 [Gemmatimonadota bacterium]